jgi:hypothetical protein
MAKQSAEDRAISRIRRTKLTSHGLNQQLCIAAKRRWAKAAKELLYLGADVNAEFGGSTALAWACRWGTDHVVTAEVLLDAKADPNGPGVMETCGIATLPILTAAGGKLNGEQSRINPLMSAIVARTKEDKALALIEAGADVNVRDEEGSTPLMLAAERGRLRVFDALIHAGANLFAVDNTGRSVLRRTAETAVGSRVGAIGSHRKVAMQILRRLRDYLPAQPEDTVIIDIILGNVKELKRKLQSGLDPNLTIAGGVGELGLRRAEYIEHLVQQGSIEQILASGVSPSRTEIDSRTGGSPLLMWAVAANNPPIVNLLLQAGANPDLKNAAGVSPRMFAVEWGDSKARALLDT